MDETTDTPVVRSLWQAEVSAPADVDEDCSPTKVCKNMRGISFDGFADDGADLRDAWRQKLSREGKLNPSAQSIGDLILGSAGRD